MTEIATRSEVSSSIVQRAQAKLTERKGFLTPRDEMTIDAIALALADELVDRGFIDPDPIEIDIEE